MNYTKKQIKEIETIVGKKVEDLENWSIEEIEEPIFVEQIEEGEIEKENFYEAITGMGLPYTKKGRIPFEEVEEIAPTLLEHLKKSSNPKIDIKDVMNMRTEKGIKKINDRISKTKKIRARDKDKVINKNNAIHTELKTLAGKKVNVNQGLMWSIYIIKRGEKRLERFNEEGKDVELLKLQNSFLDEDIIEELKELRSEYYES